MPAGCETLNVSGTTNGVADGDYTFDAATQAWINDNDVEWTLEKTWWEADSLGAGVPATSGFRWSFLFSGTTQPAGAVTTRFLQHPVLLGGVGANDTGNWAKNSIADGGSSTGSAKYNPIGVNGWHYMPQQYVNLTRWTDSTRTTVWDTGTLEVLWPAIGPNAGGYVSLGASAPTVLQWVTYWSIPAYTKIDITRDSYSVSPSIAVPGLNFILKDELSNFPNYTWNTYWEASSAATQGVPTGATAYDTSFECTATGNDASRGGNFTDYWTVTPPTPIDVVSLREFNYLVYPDQDSFWASDYSLPWADVSGSNPYYWNSTAPWVNTPVNLGTSGDSPPGDIDAGNLLTFAWGESWGIDLGMAPDGGETCPSDAVWTGTGIVVIAPPSAPTGFAAAQGTGVPAAPTNFSAGVIPAAPTNFAATQALVPAAPTNFAALGSPAAPTNFAALGSPAAPTNFAALGNPAAPTNFAATQLVVPSAPTNFGAVETGVPSAPTGFGAVLDLTTVVPNAPTGTAASLTHFAGWTKPARYKGYVYSELGKSLTGPFVGGDITALTSVQGTGSLVSVSGDDEIRSTDLSKFRERDFEEAPVGVWPYPHLAPPSTANFIVGSEKGEFAYRGRYLTSPFGESLVGSMEIPSPLYFEDGHLAIAETAWMHLGNEHNNKQVHRLDFNFSTGSFGHLWAYIQSDSEQGKVSGQYKGPIENNVRVFTNIRGRRFRVKIFIATHKDYPWNLREMAVGHLTGKSF